MSNCRGGGAEFQNGEQSQFMPGGGGGGQQGGGLYESAYPGAPGSANSAANAGNFYANNFGPGSSGPNNPYAGAINPAMESGPNGAPGQGGGSDMANQGLSLIQQGDSYDGIMALLQAAQTNPNSVNNQQFLSQLQLVESPSGSGTGSPADTTALSGQSAGPMDTSALSTAGQQNPALPNDGTGQTATGSGTGTDAGTQMAQQGLQDAQQSPATGMMELMSAATMNPNLTSDQNFLSTLQQALPGAQQATDANGNPVQPQTDANGNPIPSTGASNPNYTLPTQLSDTTNNPQSANPQIQQALQQAFTMISQGDQADAALTLMQVAQADPQILQDQVFTQNLQQAEQAGMSMAQGAAPATDTSAQTAVQPTDTSAQGAAQPTDGTAQPVDTTAQTANTATQPGAAGATGATGGADSGTQMAQQGLQDAQQNPATGMMELMSAATMNPNLIQDQNFLSLLQQSLPGAQQATDASGNPIQPQTDANGNPIPSAGASNPNYTLPTTLSDTTNNPQSANPQIQQALQQAFTMISQGDQADAALVLMQVAQVDPQILQDQVFTQNLQQAEQAGMSMTQGQTAAQSSDTSALSSQQTPALAAADTSGTPDPTQQALATPTDTTGAATTSNPTQLAMAAPTGTDTSANVGTSQSAL